MSMSPVFAFKQWRSLCGRSILIERVKANFENSRLLAKCYPRQLLGKSLSRSKSAFQGDHSFISRSLAPKYLYRSLSTNQTPEIQEIVNRILIQTRERDVMADSLSVPEIMTLVEALAVQGFDFQQIESLLSRRIWLLQQYQASVSLTHLMLSHGLDHPLVCKVMGVIPHHHHNSLHSVLDGRISDILFFFGSLGCTDQDLVSILSKSPHVLFLDLSKIQSSIANLKQLFSMKEIRKLVKTSPSLLTDEWADVYRKYEYVIYRMVYQKGDIVNSRLFSHSFHHIKSRHLFLVRCGLFVGVSMKLSSDLNPNPKLKDVVDTKTSAFLRLFPVCNLEEYQVYCQMRNLEEDHRDDVEEEEEDLRDDVEEEEDDLRDDGEENKMDGFSESRNADASQTKAVTRHKSKLKKIKS